MSNLIRGEQNYLYNSISAIDFGMYYEGGVATGNKHLVAKTAGIDINGGDDIKVSILNASVGQKKVQTLTPKLVWNGEASKTYTIEVTKEPLYDGSSTEIYPVTRQYSYTKIGFNTSTVGALNDTDKDAIINGLIAAIASDIQLSSEQVNSGKKVVGTLVNHTLVLTAIDYNVDFNARVFDGEWTIATTTPFKKPLLSYEHLCQLFAIKAENAGQIVTQPLPNTTYVKVQIRQKSAHYGNVSASVYDVAEQVYNFYMPLAALTTNYFAAIALAEDGVVPSMADSVTPAVSLQTYLNAIADVVESVDPTAMTVDDDTIAVAVGATVAFGALTWTPTNASNKAVTYSSSNEALATVAADGTITGVAAGAPVITATSVAVPTLTETVTVTVS